MHKPLGYTRLPSAHQVISELTKGMSKFFRDVICALMPHQRAVTTLSVRDLVWGYRDPLIRELCKYLPNMCSSDLVGFLAGVSTP